MKRTYRWIDGKMVEVTREPPAPSSSPFVLPDLDSAYNGGFTSPIDETFITSRAQLRDHNRRHGVRQSGDVNIEQHKAAVRKRMRYNPEARGTDGFSWVAPNSLPARRRGNMTEI